MFLPVREKKCDTHFKKVCWIDYEEKSNSETVRICTEKPERKCDLSISEKMQFKNQAEIQVHYETICETRYIQKEVTEDRPTCKNVMDKICDDKGENCMEFNRRVRNLIHF